MQTCLKHSAPNLCKSSRLKGLGGASCGNCDSKMKISVGDFNRKKEGRINEKNLPLKGQTPATIIHCIFSVSWHVVQFYYMGSCSIVAPIEEAVLHSNIRLQRLVYQMSKKKNQPKNLLKFFFCDLAPEQCFPQRYCFPMVLFKTEDLICLLTV